MCDAEYIFAASPLSYEFPCSGGSYTYAITSQKKIGSTTQAVDCIVSTSPTNVSSYSLNQASTAGTYNLSVSMQANSGTSEKLGFFKLTQSETNDTLTINLNQPACTGKTINNITSSANIVGSTLEVYLNSEKSLPLSTSIMCTIRIDYRLVGETTGTTTASVTISAGDSHGQTILTAFGSLSSVDNCCITSTDITSDDTYTYKYLTCSGWA